MVSIKTVKDPPTNPTKSQEDHMAEATKGRNPIIDLGVGGPENMKEGMKGNIEIMRIGPMVEETGTVKR